MPNPMTRLREIAAGSRRPQTATQAIATARTGQPLPQFGPLDDQQKAAIARAAVEVMQGRAAP